MKKIALLIIIISGYSCKKGFLDRFPQSQLSPETFFANAADLELYTNSFYAYLPTNEVYLDDQKSDNMITLTKADFQDIVAGRLTVPTSASDAGWTWSPLRNINYFLERYNKADAPQNIKNKYAGLAKFFRALFYFDKVKRFGDVPWYSNSLSDTSTGLYKARDSRVLVIDSVLADLDFAIASLDDVKNTSVITRSAALALKSRVCLYEGTFRKYHTEFSLPGSDGLLTQAYESAAVIMTGNKFKLYTTGHPEYDYMTLFTLADANKDEIILAQSYDLVLNKYHDANNIYLNSTRGNPGVTQSLVNTFLMKDGTRFSDIPGYGTFTFLQEVQDRDPRLSQLIRTPGYKRIGDVAVLLPDFSNARTGYQAVKFVTDKTQDGNSKNINDLPVFRYAEVLLNFAEAKAELGIISQQDIDQSINVIRTRAGMPAMTLAGLTADPVLAAAYIHATLPVILEIRRERRVELALEGFRYNDLMRWKEGHLLTDHFTGMYFPSKGDFDIDGDSKVDVSVVDALPNPVVSKRQYLVLGSDLALSGNDKGNLVIRPQEVKVFDENKHYFFPLPRTELLLNPKLTQNPGWN